MAIRLCDLVRGKNFMSKRQLKLVREWLDEDFESHDHDREMVQLVRRLLCTCFKDSKTKRPVRIGLGGRMAMPAR
jgi:hypothetical protein